MADDGDTVRAVAWQEVLPGLHLFSALRISLNFRALILAALGIVLSAAGWQLCGTLFSSTDDLKLRVQIEHNSQWPWHRPQVLLRAADLTSVAGWRDQTPLLVAWQEITAPFEEVFVAESSLVQFAYWSTCALWSLAVWALFGGAITRLAAVTFARQENQSWKQLAATVRARFGSYVAAALFPVLGVFLSAGFLALLGLAMRADAGLLAAGILWPAVLLLGFMMAFLLIGLFVGWPLMWGAISAEGTDSFGALSHAYSYAYQRPMHYLMYVLSAALIGVLGWYLVSIFANTILALTQWGVSWGTGQARLLEIVNGSQLSETGGLGQRLIGFWNSCLITLTLAFVFSYLWSSTTVIYFLLRQQVDATELDEVYMPDDGRLHGLPPLKTGSDGVAEPTDDVPGEHAEG
jgi:hypothetical protein